VEPAFDSVKKLTSNTFFDASLATDEIVKLRVEMMSGERWPALAARREAGNAFDSDSVRRQKVRKPTLIVWGMNDRSLPVELGVQAMEHFEDARFWFLPRCGHWPQTEWADHFNPTVSDFLREARESK
jgi:2-hydroxy-6-oxonona-2,4-dienedioate hydrolase